MCNDVRYKVETIGSSTLIHSMVLMNVRESTVDDLLVGVPEDVELEVLYEFEGDPMGIMVRGHQLTDDRFIGLIVRDILSEKTETDHPRQWSGQLKASLADIEVCREVWLDQPDGPWISVDDIDEEIGEEIEAAGDPFDITFCINESLGWILADIRGEA